MPGTWAISTWARFRGAMRCWLATGVVDVESQGWMGRTPLFDAAENGDREQATRLLEHGADPNARRDRGDQPLHWAADGDMVRLLLAAGADLEGEDRWGRTPLDWAARDDRADAMRALLGAGADAGKHRDGTTPLHQARSRAAVALLLERGAELDARDTSGRSPLWQAVWETRQEPRRETVRALLDRGADPLLRDQGGTSPWHLAHQRDNPWVLEQLTQTLEAAGRSVVPVVSVEEAARAPQELLRIATPDVAFSTTRHPAIVRWRLGSTPEVVRVVPGSHERIDDIAPGPGRRIALAFSDRYPEIWDWDSPETDWVVVRPEAATAATAVDISPDGRWIAIGVPEEVQLATVHDGRVVDCVESSQGTAGVRFSPDGRFLASACVSQGGAHLRLDAVGEGSLELIAELARSEVHTDSEHFVDCLGSLCFSPDGSRLLFWETARCSWESKPRGWRGNVVCFDVASRRLLWVTSMDEKLTGDGRSLHEIDRDFGYLAPFALDATGRRLAVGVGRQLLALDAGTGACRKVLKLGHGILSLAHDAARNCWLLATEAGGLSSVPTDAD